MVIPALGSREVITCTMVIIQSTVHVECTLAPTKKIWREKNVMPHEQLIVAQWMAQCEPYT